MSIEIPVSNCCGCSACASACTFREISMVPDHEGFLYPQIDISLCTSCRKCERVCRARCSPLNEKSLLQSYACMSLDNNVRSQSSSGGAFSALANNIIGRGGVVFGAKFDAGFVVVHGWTDTKEGIADFRGSKYVQSRIGKAYAECAEFLHTGRLVLFSGTPCQIAGLFAFLGRGYNNLVSVDFICHGTPSPDLWNRYLAYRETEARSSVVAASFRRKRPSWKRFNLELCFSNGQAYSASLDHDPYMQLFLRDVCLRPACYQCESKGLSRKADLTLADFWGIQNIDPEIDDDTGVSLVVAHNQKGMAVLSSSTSIFLKPVDLSRAIVFNPSIERSVMRPKKRDTFFKALHSWEFDKVLKVYTRGKFWPKIKHIPDRVVFLLKQTLGM
jgi:hypothetical protein